MADVVGITMRVNGRAICARRGDTVAAALMNAGVLGFRRSITGQPRGAVCGIGQCFECRVTIDGEPDVRACLEPCRDGMELNTACKPEWHGRAASRNPDERDGQVPRVIEVDCAVIGAGPAGLAAAEAFASAARGKRVVLLDDQLSSGGQIWRGNIAKSRSVTAMCARLGIERLAASAVVLANGPQEVVAHAGGEPIVIRSRSFVLATGARELFLPFPGWTLPGVLGVGGIQAMVKSGLNVRGKRIVVAGSGPLLVQVAAFLWRAGGRVLAVAEQAPAERVYRFARGLWRWPGKAVQGASLRAQLLAGRVPYSTDCWPVEALGDEQVRAVRLMRSDGEVQQFDCDYLASAFGLVPNTQLAALLGCRIEPCGVGVDADQRTSVSHVFAAGEACGIGGVEVAVADGRIAGANAASHIAGGVAPVRGAERSREFARVLASTFALRSEVLGLDTPSTIMCRCEDVPLGNVSACDSWREAKLQTRCGMGVCQGRTCGAASSALLGFEPLDARPPLSPIPMHVLGCLP